MLVTGAETVGDMVKTAEICKIFQDSSNFAAQIQSAWKNLFENFKRIVFIQRRNDVLFAYKRNYPAFAFLRRGVERFKGATVIAHDLRGGAALVSAGLAAEGRSEVLDIFHIDTKEITLPLHFSAMFCFNELISFFASSSPEV